MRGIMSYWLLAVRMVYAVCMLLRRVKKSSEEYGLRLNVKNTKVLSTVGLKVFTLDGMNIEVMSSFKLLRPIIHGEGTCTPKIKHRLLLGRVATGKLDKT